ncbi:MAG: UvrD-helicase domain-containing protein [Bacteroidales bacterium]|nr:UvrD-helicase domain-containing protein [Bacteroidales bacterium]
MNYLKNLNDAQLGAVTNLKGPALVIAGAGSGKTRVLTYRIVHLLKSGTPPDSILALTFTNKAAKEMKDRIIKVAGYDLSRQLWMGTFHSIFARILRSESKTLGYPSDFTIYDTLDSRNLIKTISKELQLDDKVYKPAEVLRRISAAKNNLITAGAYVNNPEIIENDKKTRKERIGDIFKIYASRCYKAGAMDFDDLLLNINILFRDFKEIREKYQKQFSYILVDEYQDTNYSQYLIIKNLAALHHNVFVVGDDAQSIYSFRGARIENILNFKIDYPDYNLYKLEENYRSTKNIVNAANSLIKKNNGQIPKKIFSNKESGNLIKIVPAKTDMEEGFIVSNSIFDINLEKHNPYCDFAILYRTNAQSRIFEEALRKRNIPYKVYGSLSFFQRKEIKDVLAYCRILINPKDDEALKRIINYPARGIGKTSLQKIESQANKTNQSMWEIVVAPDAVAIGLNKGTITRLKGFTDLINSIAASLDKSDAYDLAFRLASETGILKELHNSNSPEELSKYDNIHELLNGIREFISAPEQENRLITLGEYLQNVSLLTNADNEGEDDKNKVTIMTVHSAKGLEFKYVYIVGMEEDLFPSALSSSSIKELEEERRLFYVAITRAELQVYISYTGTRYRWGSINYCKPSRFIREIENKYIDWPLSEPETNLSSDDNFFSFKRTPYQKKKVIPKTEPMQMPAGKKWAKVNHQGTGTPNPGNFKSNSPQEIQAGMMVEHIRFGKGKVLNLEGEAPNIKATVFFKSTGQKQLLLKFAKLRIIRD